MANEALEVNASYNRSKLEDDTSNVIAVGAAYYIHKDVSLDAGYSFDSDTSTLYFGASKHF